MFSIINRESMMSTSEGLLADDILKHGQYYIESNCWNSDIQGILDWSDQVTRCYSTGVPMDLREAIESETGLTVRDVLIHYNSSLPNLMGAHAYATPTSIYIAKHYGWLLKHELAHVIQYRSGRVAAQSFADGITEINETILEREANIIASNECWGLYNNSTAISCEITDKWDISDEPMLFYLMIGENGSVPIEQFIGESFNVIERLVREAREMQCTYYPNWDDAIENRNKSVTSYWGSFLWSAFPGKNYTIQPNAFIGLLNDEVAKCKRKLEEQNIIIHRENREAVLDELYVAAQEENAVHERQGRVAIIGGGVQKMPKNVIILDDGYENVPVGGDWLGQRANSLMEGLNRIEQILATQSAVKNEINAGGFKLRQNANPSTPPTVILDDNKFKSYKSLRDMDISRQNAIRNIIQEWANGTKRSASWKFKVSIADSALELLCAVLVGYPNVVHNNPDKTWMVSCGIALEVKDILIFLIYCRGNITGWQSLGLFIRSLGNLTIGISGTEWAGCHSPMFGMGDGKESPSYCKSAEVKSSDMGGGDDAGNYGSFAQQLLVFGLVLHTTSTLITVGSAWSDYLQMKKELAGFIADSQRLLEVNIRDLQKSINDYSTSRHQSKRRLQNIVDMMMDTIYTRQCAFQSACKELFKYSEEGYNIKRVEASLDECIQKYVTKFHASLVNAIYINVCNRSATEDEVRLLRTTMNTQDKLSHRLMFVSNHTLNVICSRINNCDNVIVYDTMGNLVDEYKGIDRYPKIELVVTNYNHFYLRSYYLKQVQ